jgi:PrcB C-terminal
VAVLLAAVAVLAGWLAWARASEPPGRAVVWRDLTATLGPVQFPHSTSHAFITRAKLVKALRVAMPGRVPDPPAIDFGRTEAALIAAGPRSSTGYDLRIVSVERRGGRVVVLVRESTPTLAEHVTARLTYPYRFIVFPRFHKPVTVRWQGRP